MTDMGLRAERTGYGLGYSAGLEWVRWMPSMSA